LPLTRKNKKDNGFQTGNVTLISVAHFLHDAYSTYLPPLLPLLIEKFGISLFLSGLLGMIQRLPNLLNPFIGILAERVKVRYFVIFAPAVTTVAMSLIGIAPAYTVVAVLLFVCGLSSALFHVPAPVMVGKLSGTRKGKGMSFFMAAGELASAVGPLILVAVVEIWGLAGTLRLIPFGLAASVVLWWRLHRISIQQEVYSSTMKIDYMSVFRQFRPVFMTLGGIIIFNGTLRATLILFIPVYLVQAGEHLWFAGVSLAVLQFSGAFGTFVFGSLSDSLGRRTTLVLLTISAPLLMLLFLNSSGIILILSIVLLGIVLMPLQSIMLATVQEFDTRHLAFVNSIYMTMSFFITALMAMVAGAVADHLGLTRTYALFSVLSLAAIFFALKVPGKKTSGN
jgi:FSR family fosmidomycin resistance protein-like MFS transporter